MCLGYVQDVQGFLTFSDDQIREVFDRYKDNEGLIDARKVRHSLTHQIDNPTTPTKYIFSFPYPVCICVWSCVPPDPFPPALHDTQSKAIMQGVYNSPTPPRWIADKFRGWFCRFGSRPDGMCDWPEFLKAVHAVRQSCSLDASTKPVGFPQWIKDSKKVRESGMGLLGKGIRMALHAA